MKKLTNKISLLLLVMLVATMTITGCGNNATNNQTQDATQTQEATQEQAASDVTVLGEGATVFNFNVVDGDANTTKFEIHTDASTVGEALLALNLIAGDESEYGLYVKTVNGIVADYDVDQTYWAFYIDGEYAMTGVDSTDVTAGSTYEFKVEK